MSEFCNFDDTSHFVGPSSELLNLNAVHTSAVRNYFFVPLRAPTSFACSRAHLEITASQCSPYFSSSQLFAKSVTPFAITVADTIMSKLLLCCKSLLQIDKSIFFANNCELVCVCSFFFVTLRREIY